MFLSLPEDSRLRKTHNFDKSKVISGAVRKTSIELITYFTCRSWSHAYPVLVDMYWLCGTGRSRSPLWCHHLWTEYHVWVKQVVL